VTDPQRDAAQDASGSEQARGRTPRRRWTLVGGVVAAVVILDQATKIWAVDELADGPMSIIGSDVELSLTRNTGGAFSLFQGFTPFLALLAVGIALVLVRAVRRADDTLSLVALALVLGGALGNLIDRLARAPGFLEGAVVDFVKVGSFPTFNVADSAITIGALLLIVALLLPVREANGA
jgi:signal peptidase II